MKYEFLLVETTNHVRRITINRPAKKNALNVVGYEELTRALNEAAKDEDVKVCVLTGAGDFFSAGNDLKQKHDPNISIDKYVKAGMIRLANLVRAFYTFPKLLMAVVNGPSIGIAATTIALCDVVYCSETAYFRTPFANLGICAEACSSYTFPRIMGTSMASSMLYLNHQMGAQEAYNFHFVSKVYKNKDVQQIWDEISKYGDLPLSSIKAIKMLSQKWNVQKLEEANLAECEQLGKMFNSKDAREAKALFNKKSNL